MEDEVNIGNTESCANCGASILIDTNEDYVESDGELYCDIDCLNEAIHG